MMTMTPPRAPIARSAYGREDMRQPSRYLLRPEKLPAKEDMDINAILTVVQGWTGGEHI